MTKYVDSYVCKLARSLRPIQEHIIKFGGAPVFMRPVEWPLCQHSAQKMTFLAQIPLQQPIFFSRKYAMAYVFMCPGKYDHKGWLECKNWLPFSGANAVILQEHSDMIGAGEAASEYPDYSVNFEYNPEPLIDTTDYLIDEEISSTVSEFTKIGGVPLWLQENETPFCPHCNQPMRFVAQFSAELDGPLPADSSEWHGEKFKFFDFGDVGIGYMFICENECGSAFLWQCS
ncbi:MAG: hypothetical protein AB1894_06205 [Chloroflexota bacterium]